MYVISAYHTGVECFQIDYLRNVRGPGRPADMLVDKKDLAYVQRFLSQKGIQNDIVGMPMLTEPTSQFDDCKMSADS